MLFKEMHIDVKLPRGGFVRFNFVCHLGWAMISYVVRHSGCFCKAVFG